MKDSQAPNTGHYAPQRKYVARMISEGFSRVTLWVHYDDADRLSEMAEKLRSQRKAVA